MDARYAKSDPIAAIRRDTGDLRSASDILALISKTEAEISRIKSDMISTQDLGLDQNGISQPSTDVGATESANLSGNWLSRQLSHGKRNSMSDMNKVEHYIRILII